MEYFLLLYSYEENAFSLLNNNYKEDTNKNWDNTIYLLY